MNKSIIKCHCISNSVEISFVGRAPAMLPLALHSQISHTQGQLFYTNSRPICKQSSRAHTFQIFFDSDITMDKESVFFPVL